MSRTELEATIDADPYDPRGYAVLADHLQEIGDPRGELIALQLAPRKGAMEDAVGRHFAAHAAAFDFEPGVDARWAFGFARSIKIESPRPGILRRTLAHPSARFLVELELGLRDPEVGLEEEVRVLAGHRHLCLRSLAVAVGTGARLAWLGEVGALWAQLPQLRRLHLIGACEIATPFALPLLEELAIGSFRMQVSTPSAIAAASWPSLVELSLRPGVCTDHTVEGIAHALAQPFPKLRRLGFADTGRLDDIVPWLVRSPILPQLTELALVGGSLSDDGIDVLVRHAPAIRHLTKIDVSGNPLSGDAHAALRSVIGNVDTTPGELDDVDSDLYDY